MKLDYPPEEYEEYEECEECPTCRYEAVEQAASALMEADWALWEFARLTFENNNSGPGSDDIDDDKLMAWCGAVQYRTGLRVPEEMAADFYRRWLNRRDNPPRPYLLQVNDEHWYPDWSPRTKPSPAGTRPGLRRDKTHQKHETEEVAPHVSEER